MKYLLIIMLLNSIHSDEPSCSLRLPEYEYVCKGVKMDNFHDALFKKMRPQSQYSLSIKIVDSDVKSMEYFPEIPVPRDIECCRIEGVGVPNMQKLTIKNSSLNYVGPHAFEELDFLELDLSWNQLRDISFVQQLKGNLKNLVLSNNKIVHVDNVLQRFFQLNYLDLSYNSIAVLDLNVVHRIRTLNVANNNISNIFPFDPKKYNVFRPVLGTLNVSHNILKEFNETDLGLSLENLDISFNNLSIVELNGGSNYNLSHNSLKYFHNTSYSQFNNLDLSGITNISSEWNIKVHRNLILSGGEWPSIRNLSADFPKIDSFYFPGLQIDLSYSSIQEIPAYYFKDFQFTLLNLSHNKLPVLKNNVYQNARINIVDLSNNLIERIEPEAFADVSASSLDLSSNLLRSISKTTFAYIHNLEILNLSSCSIKAIEAGAFASLDLKKLDVGYNKLYILEQGTFANFSVKQIRLTGNDIGTIRSKAFSNIRLLENLNLTKLNLKTLETKAFCNLFDTETVDLSDNMISIVPHELFMNIPRLKTVILKNNPIKTLNPLSNKLKLLNLSLGYIGVFEPNGIMNFNIQKLLLKDCEIDVLKANAFNGMFGLNELNFTGSHIYLVEPGALNHLYNLKFLDSQDLFKHTKHLKQNAFADLNSLESLNVSFLSLKSVEANSFLGLTKLKHLQLNNNNLQELNNHTFAGLVALQILNLSFNNISSYEDDGFVGLTNLEELQLDHNGLTNIGSVFSKDLVSLKVLRLEHNSIQSISTESFLSFPRIEKLCLDHNFLEGVTPGTFRNLVNLEWLSLSNNRIKMFSNGEFSNLKSLRRLDVSYNEIVKIGHSSIFYSMRKLETLYLDGNRLKDLDFNNLLNNLKFVRYIGISSNKWSCDFLSVIISVLNNKTVDYEPLVSNYIDDNVDGVYCIDICKFIYCQEEGDGMNLAQ